MDDQKSNTQFDEMVEKFKQDTLAQNKAENPNLNADTYFKMPIQNLSSSYKQCQSIMKKGKLSEQLLSALLKLYICILQAITDTNADSTIQSLIVLRFDVLNLLLVYYLNFEDQQYTQYCQDIAKSLWQIQKANQSSSQRRNAFPDFDEYYKMLYKNMKEDYPEIKLQKKSIAQNPQELQEEAMKVKTILSETPVIPEKEGLIFHIVDIDWFKAWKAYTGYAKVKVGQVDHENETPGNGDDQSSTIQEEENHLTDDFSKLHVHNSETATVADSTEAGSILGLEADKHPGPINEGEEFKKIFVSEAFLKYKDNEIQLQTLAKEDEHYVLLPDEAWKYLHEIYGGVDIPRYSIEIPTDDEDRKEFMIEVFYKKLCIYILPKVKHHVSLKRACGVYISRRAKIMDFRRKVAEIIYDSKSEQTVDDLINMARLWRLEIGETVEDIEDLFNQSSTIPVGIRGRILDDKEIVDEINVADTDTLLYEVMMSNRGQYTFGFAPKSTIKVEKKSRDNKALVQLPEEKQNQEYILSLPLEKCIDVKAGGKCGLVGLQNLGNTCFMNSVIQCLSNTEPLVKYFIFDLYLDHINEKNTLGTRGRLAKAFSELLSDIYTGGNSYVAPWDIKNIISRRAIQFQGFAQHDSQEMLSFLLENLHEDLNRVTKKPYIEHQDCDGRKDDEVSLEYWEGFKKRDQSLMIDLFYGQLKSRVQCTVCNKISISFDPFNMLSVPIPINKECKLAVKYFPYTLQEKPKEFLINVADTVTLQELRSKILEALGFEAAKNQVFICKAKNKSNLEMLVKEKMIRTNLEKGEEMCVYERPQLHEPIENFFLVEVKIFQHKRSYMFFNSVQPISHSRLFIFNRRMTVKDVKIQLFKYFRPLIQDIDAKYISGKNLSEEQKLLEEYNYYFNNKQTQSSSYESGNPLYAIYINNNLPTEQGLISSSQVKCDFCDKYHKGANCLFDFADNLIMNNVLKKMENDRDFELVVQWNSNPQANIKLIESPDFEYNNLAGNSVQSKYLKGQLGIDDCISWFSAEEMLTGNDKWYCPSCKHHQNALKKMEIYRAPEFLIIHLKRFSHQTSSFFSSRKISDLIDFPIEGLDLEQFVLHKKGDDSLIYDLYAVSNHFGSLNGGHYTAYCQNQINQRWYEFDDTDVQRIDPSKVVSKAAYVLFYRRRRNTKK